MLISMVCNGFIQKGGKICKTVKCGLHLKYQASHKRSPWSDGKGKLLLAERGTRLYNLQRLHCPRAGDWAERLLTGKFIHPKRDAGRSWKRLGKESGQIAEQRWASEMSNGNSTVAQAGIVRMVGSKIIVREFAGHEFRALRPGRD